LPTHKLLDAASEASKGVSKIGSTLRGISPTYIDKAGRNGLRIGDILLPDFKERYNKIKEGHLKMLALYKFDFSLEEFEQPWKEAIEYIRAQNLIDSEYFLNDALSKGKKILAEGAQGTMLDIDFGTYPFVTSSNTITSGACNGLGIPPTRIREVIGITKAYCTRVGTGPFPTELDNEMGEKIRKIGNEFGATTGRPRRTGWIDLPALKYAIMINGVTQIAITKSDILNDFEAIEACTDYEINGATTKQLPFDLCTTDIKPVYHKLCGWKTDLRAFNNYDDLPETFLGYLNFLEEYLGTDITMISTGPEREKLLFKKAMEVVS
jgi:adenylosuccinate synthase